jgi:cyclophilin family peptidyl-prolyl cis-trans isomerase
MKKIIIFVSIFIISLNAKEYIKIAVLSTNYGKIEIELFPKLSPMTVNNFYSLASIGYFNGVIFHRISKNFVIQTGDPTGTGEGGSSIFGKEFADEIDTNNVIYKEGYKRGIVAMANAGPNTNTSQFFIMLSDRPQMPRKYTIIGKVIKGMDVVDKIAKTEIDPNKINFNRKTDGKPIKDIFIERIIFKEITK